MQLPNSLTQLRQNVSFARQVSTCCNSCTRSQLNENWKYKY